MIVIRKLTFIFAYFFLGLTVNSYGQGMIIPAAIDDRIDASIAVFEGEVVKQTSFWNDDQSLIYTAHVVEVYKVFKGTITQNQVEFITQGGTVGLQATIVNPSLELGIGDVGMFLADATAIIQTPHAIPLQFKFEPVDGVQSYISYDLCLHYWHLSF